MSDLRNRIAAVLWSHGWGVHTHGAEQDEGLACRERLVDGKLRGECYWRQADAVIAVVHPYFGDCYDDGYEDGHNAARKVGKPNV